MSRYTVTTSMTPSGPIYQIYDRVTDAVLEGGFDTEKWAESICEMMNAKEKERQYYESGRISLQHHSGADTQRNQHDGGTRPAD